MNVANIQDPKTKALATRAKTLLNTKVKALTGVVATKQTQLKQLVAKSAAVVAKAIKARK